MLDSARHRAKLVEVLKDIYDDPELRTALGIGVKFVLEVNGENP